MTKDLELWPFIVERLNNKQSVVLLVVATSSGSSPGRQGYKMAVGASGELAGSIGGGVMEVNLVEQSRKLLAVGCRSPHVSKGETRNAIIIEQVHQKNSPDASGMICSGRQTVILRPLTPKDLKTIKNIIDDRGDALLEISHDNFRVISDGNATVGERAGRAPENERMFHAPEGTPVHTRVSARGSNEKTHFQKISDTEFTYLERLGLANDLYIIGGGHCALALSELMSRLDFRISIFDDRPELNTLEKNRFAHEIKIIDGYDDIADFIPSGESSYVVVMTLGYASDEIVIRRLLAKDFKYFGVLGSRAKMATLMNNLKKEGLPADRLAKIHTPIGLPINSHTPEEIAVSIAAEIISVKNQ